jgi:type I restriction enzyme S subunit
MLHYFTSIKSRYLFYYISRNFALVALDGGAKSTVDSLRRPMFTNFQVTNPPLPEQTAIAAYLDAATAIIDAFMREQDELIALLKEKRQALISHCVTKGLDPSAPLKDSGIEWLGMVPEHWEVKKLGLVANFKGGAGFPDDFQGEKDLPIPFFKVGDIINADQDGVMTIYNHSITEIVAKDLRAFIFPRKTIVFAKVGAALLLRRYRRLGQRSCIDNNLMGMMLLNPESTDFTLYVLPLLDLDLIVNPGAVPSINEGQISNQKIPLPPLPEQTAIAAYLDAATAKIDALMAEAEGMIERMCEHRSSLISHVVTGKVRVMEVGQ